jgi:hypothetical protein
MKNYDLMFETEQNKVAIEKELAQQKHNAEVKVILDFCNSGLFDFLDYLQSKFYIIRSSVNYHIDGEKYERPIVYNYDRESAIKKIEKYKKFTTGIQHKWSNGGTYDTLKVKCIDLKPLLYYHGKVVSLEQLENKVVEQVQEAIDKVSPSFQILKK